MYAYRIQVVPRATAPAEGERKADRAASATRTTYCNTRCNTLQHAATLGRWTSATRTTHYNTCCNTMYRDIYTHTRGGRIPSLADVKEILYMKRDLLYVKRDLCI